MRVTVGCSASVRNYRKLLLAALDWTRPKDPPLSLGHASILANLSKHKLEVFEKSWAVNASDFSNDEVVEFAIEHADDHTDFALGAFVWNEIHTQNILDKLKKAKFPGRIILGGPQISYVKSGVENYYPQADVFIRGYAEEALAKLLLTPGKAAMPPIKGVHYANQPDLGLSATVDFESLPSPFLTNRISPQPFIRWETQRGCPFRCSFCQHRETDMSMKRRGFSEDRLLKETSWMVENPIIQDVAVLDPTFNSGSRYLQLLETLCDKRFTGKLALQCRMEMVTPEFLNLVERLNQTARVVLEFGLQTVHKEEQRVIQRPNNMKRVRQVLIETADRNIETEVSLIFGLPSQTLSSFKETVEFCLNLDVPTIHAFPLMLLRGTPLYDLKSKLKLIESSDVEVPEVDRLYDGIPHVISSPTFTFSDWQVMAGIASELEHRNKTAKNPSLNSASLFKRNEKNNPLNKPEVADLHLGSKSEAQEFVSVGRLLKTSESFGRQIEIELPAFSYKPVGDKYTDLVKTVVGSLFVKNIVLSASKKILLIELSDEISRQQLELLNPHHEELSSCFSSLAGIIVTLKTSNVGEVTDGKNASFDFISRYFAPWLGIPEDTVTGSVHSFLGTYWSEVLGKKTLFAHQCSPHECDLHVCVNENRVHILKESFYR